MFLSENNYQLPRRAPNVVRMVSFESKAESHTAQCRWVLLLDFCACMRARRLAPRYSRHSQGVYIYSWECGVRGLSVGVTIK